MSNHIVVRSEVKRSVNSDLTNVGNTTAITRSQDLSKYEYVPSNVGAEMKEYAVSEDLEEHTVEDRVVEAHVLEVVLGNSAVVNDPELKLEVVACAVEVHVAVVVRNSDGGVAVEVTVRMLT